MENSRPRNFGGQIERKVPPVQVQLQEAIDAEFADKMCRLPDGGWEYNLTYRLNKDFQKEVINRLKTGDRFLFNFLVDITAVDWLDNREPRFDVVYQLHSLTLGHRLTLKVEVPEEHPELDSVEDLWKAANFLEREVWDMFGISFRGHPDLRRILMYDEFVGHPLRKDYPLRGKQPRVPLRIPELRHTSDDMHREELVPLPTRQRARHV